MLGDDRRQLGDHHVRDHRDHQCDGDQRGEHVKVERCGHQLRDRRPASPPPGRLGEMGTPVRSWATCSRRDRARDRRRRPARHRGRGRRPATACTARRAAPGRRPARAPRSSAAVDSAQLPRVSRIGACVSACSSWATSPASTRALEHPSRDQRSLLVADSWRRT